MASCNSPANSPAKRVLIVHNPGAGAGGRQGRIDDLAACLRSLGLEPEVVGDLDTLGTRSVTYQSGSQLRAIVAAGGDGTVMEVVNRTEPGVPVTVFPLGTANLLAGYLTITSDPQAAAQMLAEGAIIRLDAARANGRIFLLMAGCGFDADVVQRLHRRRRGRHISYWTWAQPILQSIRRYGFPELRVYCDAATMGSGEVVHSARWAFVVNLPVYAAGLSLAPGAVGTDGKLNVCTFSRGSFWHGLRYVGHAALGRHDRLPDYKQVTAVRIRIEADQPVPYQLDGDPGGVLPLEIEVLPARLTLVAPRARVTALTQGRMTASDRGA